LPTKLATKKLQQSTRHLADNELPVTLGFMQVGLDLVTSANCKSQLQFQQTNNYELLYIFNQQVRADGILFPNLHKALNVVRNYGTRLQLYNHFQKIKQVKTIYKTFYRCYY
jgi:hypothetical protein